MAGNSSYKSGPNPKIELSKSVGHPNMPCIGEAAGKVMGKAGGKTLSRAKNGKIGGKVPSQAAKNQPQVGSTKREKGMPAGLKAYIAKKKGGADKMKPVPMGKKESSQRPAPVKKQVEPKQAKATMPKMIRTHGKA